MANQVWRGGNQSGMSRIAREEARLLPDLSRFEEHLQATSGSARTVRAYVADARAFVLFLGDRVATVDAVEDWVAFLNHGRCAPQTINRKMAAVRRWLGFVSRHGDEQALRTLAILKDYRVTPAVRQADVKETRPISTVDFFALRERSRPHYRALWDILWWTGARISEVLGDALTGIPSLSGADLKAMVQEGYVRTRGKGGQRRLLVLPPAGIEVVRGFVETLSDNSRAFPLTPRAVNAALHRLGFTGGAHAFRHAYRARLRHARISEEIQARLMGHGPRSTTHGYGVAEVAEIREAVSRLS